MEGEKQVDDVLPRNLKVSRKETTPALSVFMRL